MRCFLMFVVILIAGVLCAADAAIFSTSFDDGEVEDYFETVPAGVEFTTSDEDGRCLAISKEVGKVNMKTVSVEPGEKYKLWFRGRVESDFTVERNDRAHIEALQRPWLGLAGLYEIGFYDDQGEELNSSRGFILTSEWCDYVNVFYTPPDAEKLRVQFLPRGRETFIDQMNLTKEAEEGTINPNPDFRYGELNYCGWTASRGGRLYERPDGRVVFQSGPTGFSPFFPLKENKEYKISGRGEGGRVEIFYFDKEGMHMNARFLFRLSEEGESMTLNPPEGTRIGRLKIRGENALEELRVIQVEK